jgi:hypothetical protein
MRHPHGIVEPLAIHSASSDARTPSRPKASARSLLKGQGACPWSWLRRSLRRGGTSSATVEAPARDAVWPDEPADRPTRPDRRLRDRRACARTREGRASFAIRYSVRGDLPVRPQARDRRRGRPACRRARSRPVSKTTARCSTSGLTERPTSLRSSPWSDDGSEIVIHAVRMRAQYEPFLHGDGDSDA